MSNWSKNSSRDNPIPSSPGVDVPRRRRPAFVPEQQRTLSSGFDDTIAKVYREWKVKVEGEKWREDVCGTTDNCLTLSVSHQRRHGLH